MTGLFTPLFVGPTAFLLGTLLLIVVALVVARIIFAIAWRIIVILAVVLGVLWLLGAIGAGPPGLA